jgi:hypothetical protein
MKGAVQSAGSLRASVVVVVFARVGGSKKVAFVVIYVCIVVCVVFCVYHGGPGTAIVLKTTITHFFVEIR